MAPFSTVIYWCMEGGGSWGLTHGGHWDLMQWSVAHPPPPQSNNYFRNLFVTLTWQQWVPSEPCNLEPYICCRLKLTLARHVDRNGFLLKNVLFTAYSIWLIIILVTDSEVCRGFDQHQARDNEIVHPKFKTAVDMFVQKVVWARFACKYFLF